MRRARPALLAETLSAIARASVAIGGNDNLDIVSVALGVESTTDRSTTNEYDSFQSDSVLNAISHEES